jgi:putative hemolysin
MGNYPQVATSSLVTSPVAEGLRAGLGYVFGTFGRYRVRLAQDGNDRIAACRLRFNVFNVEKGEGLSSSYSTGLDQDRFDSVCDHLIVEDSEDGQVVGTYRMQPGFTAAAAFGYYSAQEFEFAPYECIRQQVLELARISHQD